MGEIGGEREREREREREKKRKKKRERESSTQTGGAGEREPEKIQMNRQSKILLDRYVCEIGKYQMNRM